MRAKLIPALIFLSTIVTTGLALSSDTYAQSRQVTVQGEGTVTVDPDEAVVRFGVVTVNADPERARALNAEAAARAMNAIRDLGVEERHIKLETLRLQPRQEYNRQAQRYEEKGFEAVREVRVTLKDLDQLPVLVSRIVQQGANRLNNISYGLSDRETVRQQALVEAAKNARIKAALLAETLGSELGPVREINENGVQIPQPRFEASMQVARMADAAPEPDAYASGQIEVVARVTVAFYLLN